MLEYTGQYGFGGSLIGAILQACGVISLQNLIIEAEEYFRALGVLFFIAAVVTVITKIATGGTLRQGLLLLLGPLLGVTALFTTVPVVLDETKAVGEVTLESGVLSFFGEDKDLDTLEVPLVVVLINRFTKSVTTQLSAFILSDKVEEAATSASRDRMMSRILSAENVDSNYKMLLTLSLSGDCAEITSNDWELSRPKYKNAVPESINAQMAAQLKAKRDSLALKRHRLDTKVLEYLTGLGLTPVETPTCDEIWLYTRDASFNLADKMLQDASRYRSEFPELTDEEWRTTLEFVKEKLAPAGTVASDWTQAYRVLAAFLLRNTFSKTAHGVTTDAFSSHTDWMLQRQEDGDWDLSDLEKSIDQLRMTVVRFAAAVPYVQGLCFYLLLVSFPFFCLLMIFPQKIGSLVTWASIWLWICSWEVGFAIVALIREILWKSLPHIGDELVTGSGPGTVSRLATVDWSDPASLFSVLTASSPEQHFQTYYGLIATLTLSVPILTGYCFQAANQIVDIIQRAWTPGSGGRAR